MFRFTALALFLSAFAGHAQAGNCDLVVDEVALAADARDAYPDNVTVDLYRCSEETKSDSSRPLIVFACGGSIFKSSYRKFAKKITRRGYVVAVIDHPVVFGPPGSPTRNFANALDVSNTIAYVEKQTFQVDLSRIVLMGHSYGFGTVLNAIEGLCPFPFCNAPPGQSVMVPRHSGIVLATAYGAALAAGGGTTQTAFSTLTNDDIPIAIFNGAGDTNYFNELAGENLTNGTFARLNPMKTIVTIEDLDHFSISEQDPDPNRGDVLSTLPRDDQINMVVRAVASWLNKNTPQIMTSKNFCKKMENRGKNKGFKLASCMEEYS